MTDSCTFLAKGPSFKQEVPAWSRVVINGDTRDFEQGNRHN